MKYCNMDEVLDLHKTIFDSDIDKYNTVSLVASLLRRIGMDATDDIVMYKQIENFRVKVPCAVKNVVSCVMADSPFDGIISRFFINSPLILPDTYTQFTTTELEQAYFTTRKEYDVEHFAVTPKPISPFVYVDFKQIEDIVKFNVSDICVRLEMRAMAMDEEGLPLIPDIALECVVYYIKFIDTQAKFMSGIIGGDKLQYIQSQYYKSFNKAKSDLFPLNRNELDKALATYTSMNRKRPDDSIHL